MIACALAQNISWCHVLISWLLTTVLLASPTVCVAPAACRPGCMLLQLSATLTQPRLGQLFFLCRVSSSFCKPEECLKRSLGRKGLVSVRSPRWKLCRTPWQPRAAAVDSGPRSSHMSSPGAHLPAQCPVPMLAHSFPISYLEKISKGKSKPWNSFSYKVNFQYASLHTT